MRSVKSAIERTTPPATRGIAAVSNFVKVLADAQSYWNIPREREDLWHALETWRRALPVCEDPALRRNIELFMRKLVADMSKSDPL